MRLETICSYPLDREKGQNYALLVCLLSHFPAFHPHCQDLFCEIWYVNMIPQAPHFCKTAYRFLRRKLSIRIRFPNFFSQVLNVDHQSSAPFLKKLAPAGGENSCISPLGSLTVSYAFLFIANYLLGMFRRGSPAPVTAS